MRVIGQRADGAFHLSIGDGLSVILRGEQASRAVEPQLVEQQYGPWEPANNDLGERRRLTAKLELARVAALETFKLAAPRYTPEQAKQFKGLASKGLASVKALAAGDHPFQWCMDNVIPKMAEEGKEPDDPEAFCAWWKDQAG
jgi:hypothetical protein